LLLHANEISPDRSRRWVHYLANLLDMYNLGLLARFKLS